MITRFDAIVFIVWQLAIYFACQQLFVIFANWIPIECRANVAIDDGNISSAVLTDECVPCAPNTTQFHSMAVEFGLVCPSRAYLLPLLGNLQFGGVLVGTIGFGYLSDQFGRKPLSIVCTTLGFVTTVLSGLAPNWQLYYLLRLLVCASVGGTIVVVYTYVMELIRPDQRMLLRAFFNWGWGRVVLTLVCLAVPHWRYASFVTALLMLPMVPLIYFLFPESPTWLHNQRRIDDMEKSERRLARLRCIPYEPVVHAPSTPPRRICTLLIDGRLRQRTIVLWMLWFTASLSSYANDLNSSNLHGNLYLNQILFALMIALSKMLLYLLDRTVPQFSRRALHQLPQSIVIVCFVAIVALFVAKIDSAQLILAINLLGTVCIEYTWDACYLSAAEGYPTSVRASGVGSCSMIARVGALLSPQLAYFGTVWRPGPYMIVAMIGTVCLALSIAFLPETKGVNLDAPDPVTTADIDQEDTLQPLKTNVEQQ